MSSTKFAQFIATLGLILTQGLHAINLIHPAFRFADKLEGAPEAEFYDILKVREAFYLAGSGLTKVENGIIEKVFTSGRYTALCFQEEGNRVWYAGSEGIGALDRNGVGSSPVQVEVGYVWDLILIGEKLWYFGSLGYGWIDTKTGTLSTITKKEFLPRPAVFQTGPKSENLFVSDQSGLHMIVNNSHQLVLGPESLGSNLVSWMVYKDGIFLIGTVESIYEWSGTEGEEPRKIESNYHEYFSKGISNAARLGDDVVITEYPFGLAIWDISDSRISGYIGKQSGLDIGDVYKIRSSGEADVYVLGTGGVAKADLSSRNRFFPSSELWSGSDYRSAGNIGDKGILFSGEEWIVLDENGYRRNPLKGNPLWISTNLQGNIIIGDVDTYETLENFEWEHDRLSQPVYDVKWGEQIGYAIGQNGLYSLDEDLQMELLFPYDGPISFLGEFDGAIYFHLASGEIFSLLFRSGNWIQENHDKMFYGSVVKSIRASDQAYFYTEDGFYRFTPESLESLPIDDGWEVRGLGSTGDRLYAGLYNRGTMESAIALYRGEESRMIIVPHLDQVGELRDIFCTPGRLGLVGENGLGWYDLNDLMSIEEPQVSFELLFENKQVENRTIPSGMHFIDLKINYSHPEIPSRVQYRINEQRWRNISPQDPSLQFTGHGSFTVELRAIHPNGITTPTKVVQFGIAPPWYLNPVYQVILLIIAMLLVWGIYILRHRQLKKTNLWLESEVRKQTRELQTATEARTNFLAGLSHDIRNPLNGVLMIAETLSRDPPKSGEDRRLRDLTEFGIIVDRMLGEILDFSAIDQSNVPTTFIPVSIADILRSSVVQNQFSIQQEMINLKISLPQELESVIIKTDRNWMIKVLANLIINAIQYSGTERIEVGARNYLLTEKEVDLEIFVKDWGCGIDDSEKHLIFDRFYRGESGIESGKHGTGLGLSICQDIAHAMGGHLLIEDNKPQGSTFILRGRFERVEGAVELDKDAVLAGLRGKDVLVVDDLDYNRHSIVDFLSAIGCRCDQSGNGREALNMLDKKSYELALLDWDLPGMMGPDIARAHRKAHPEDKVILIALTAYTEAEKKNLSEKSGMNGYISKPLTASRLAYSLANISEEKPEKSMGADRLDQEELLKEVQNHIEECILHGENSEWENLRRCAHRMTTLALSLENKAMQQVCRDLQIAAQSENLDDIHIGLAEIRQWRNL